MFVETNEIVSYNCSNCGSQSKLEVNCVFKPDHSMECSCGQCLKFAEDFKDKSNTYGFEEEF